MATTNAYTVSQTTTLTRIYAIKSQFRIAFQRIMEYSEEECSPYMEAIGKKKIKSVSFWAYKRNQLGEREKWAQLTLSVDWKKHVSFLLEGSDSVVLKKKWEEIIPEIGAAIDLFNSLVSEFDLTPTFSIYFSSDIRSDEYDYYMKKLGLKSGSTVKWKDSHKASELTTLLKETIKELQELSFELQVCDKIE